MFAGLIDRLYPDNTVMAAGACPSHLSSARNFNLLPKFLTPCYYWDDTHFVSEDLIKAICSRLLTLQKNVWWHFTKQEILLQFFSHWGCAKWVTLPLPQILPENDGIQSVWRKKKTKKQTHANKNVPFPNKLNSIGKSQWSLSSLTTTNF